MASIIKKALDLYSYANSVKAIVVFLIGLLGSQWAGKTVCIQTELDYVIALGIGFCSGCLGAWLFIKLGEYAWRISYPVHVSIVANGGAEFALLFHPFRKGVYTIIGQLSGTGVKYRSPFTLFRRTLKADEENTIRVANYSGGELNPDSWGVRVYGDSGSVYFHGTHRYSDRYTKTEWITLRLRVRMEGLRRSSDYRYKFRFGNELGFEVKTVSTSHEANSDL